MDFYRLSIAQSTSFLSSVSFDRSFGFIAVRGSVRSLTIDATTIKDSQDEKETGPGNVQEFTTPLVALGDVRVSIPGTSVDIGTKTRTITDGQQPTYPKLSASTARVFPQTGLAARNMQIGLNRFVAINSIDLDAKTLQ